MGGKVVIAFLEIFLLIVLIISPQVVVARELQVSHTIEPAKAGKNYKSLNPNRPVCNGRVYGSCIPKIPPRRKCNSKNNCRGGPPAQPEN